MSDPRFRLPNRVPRPHGGRMTASTAAMWAAAVVAYIVVLGIALYTNRGHLTASNGPSMIAGQSTRADAAAATGP